MTSTEPDPPRARATQESQTPQGFNALLKIVEEPPEHVKFIFATTEPEKVIGTIRSRTHHYPFRLVPPAQMLEYVQSLCVSEKVDVAPGVLPLVVRAGGGSVRDTLSILDQLIAGSEGSSVLYERAVALLGYTHGALLSEVIDAIGSRDAAAAFTAVDRVIQTGQDPRRFVEDLLERLRDLIIVSATTDGAAAVLRGIQQDELDRMAAQAAQFGTAELSRAADVVNAGLTEMTGATSPRLHLELMIARVLVPASDDSERGALARVERLERRIGVAAPVAQTAAVTPPAAVEHPPVSEPTETIAVVSSPTISAGEVDEIRPVATAETTVSKSPQDPSTVTFQQVKDAWPEVLEAVEKAKRSAWMVVFTAKPLELRADNVLVLSFASQSDVDALRQPSAPGDGVGDHLKQAVFDVLGFRPLLIARAEVRPEMHARQSEPARDPEPAREPQSAREPQEPPLDQEPPEPTEPDIEPAVPSGTTWATAVITDAEPETKPVSATPVKTPVAKSPKPIEEEPVKERPAPIATVDGKQRYGESVVREILGASFIEELTVTPRVAPREQ